MKDVEWTSHFVEHELKKIWNLNIVRVLSKQFSPIIRRFICQTFVPVFFIAYLVEVFFHFKGNRDWQITIKQINQFLVLEFISHQLHNLLTIFWTFYEQISCWNPLASTIEHHWSQLDKILEKEETNHRGNEKNCKYDGFWVVDWKKLIGLYFAFPLNLHFSLEGWII